MYTFTHIYSHAYVAGVKIKYPTLPLSLRTIKREETKFASTDKDANFKYIDVEMLMSDYF